MEKLRPLTRLFGKIFNPSSPEADIARGWQSVDGPLSQIDTPPTFAQATAVGRPFRRRVGAGPNSPGFSQEHHTVFVAGHGGPAAENAYVPATRARRVHPGDLPHLVPGQITTHYDFALDGHPGWPTVSRRRASQPHFGVDAQVRARGGNPSYRIPKPPESFRLHPNGKREMPKRASTRK